MTSASEKQNLDCEYELLYHPQIPGRGEFIRLALEVAGVSYVDIANERKDGYSDVQSICMTTGIGVADNPPVFSPPALRIHASKSGEAPLIIHQTPNVLIYIGEKHNLLPKDDAGRFHAQQIVMTALDLNNEIHDSHHPINSMDFYEQQRDTALAKAPILREHRFPKFFSYFQRALEFNRTAGNGSYLVGNSLTIADLTVWQVIDGSMFAFPKEMSIRKKDFPLLLDHFYTKLREEPQLKRYLSSGRRLPYGMGVFRHYEELDRQDE